jgi:putative aldouronate transport system substrate-binding protein
MKKVLMVVVASLLSMALILTGCGSSGDNNNVSADTTQQSTANNSDSTSGDVLKDGKKTVLKVVFPGGASSPASLEGVETKMNEIVGKHMDAVVDLDILEWGVFADQQNLMLSSGEDVALMFTFSSSRNYAASNQVRDITDLCEKYAPEALEVFGKYVDACRINGRLYGLPTFHEYARASGLVCRTDILEELKYDVSSIKTWEDLEPLLAKVKEAYPEMNVLCPVEVGSGILDYYNAGTFDILTEGVGVYVKGDGSEVLNIYNTPEFMKLAEVAYDWNKKGYFMSDATTVTDTRQDLLAAGNTFGYIGIIHPGTATQELKNAGVPVTTIISSDILLNTSGVNFAQYMVPTACSTPEKAVKLLDIMLTNKDMANLLMYGLEGKDYVVKDEANGIVGYPEGVNSSNVGWNNETWLAGNGSLAYVWESDEPGLWDKYLEFNNSGTVSPLFGFTFDAANVKSEISAVQNVINKYESVICAGYSDPSTSVAKMVSELEAAGINRIIDEAEAQIEKWKSSNK